MGKLVYFITTSLDGFVADQNGNFDWAMPSEEVHAFVNDIVRNVGTFLFGSKMYQVMRAWESMPEDPTSQAVNDFASIWKGAKKIVYSTTLTELSIANASVERSFDPRNVQKLIAASDKDFGIGGPNLAGQAIKAGLVDEYHQIIAPVIIGGGNPWLPKDAKLNLKLTAVHQFQNGFVHLQYSKA
jgi:dihydrofolate reductase